MSAVLLRSKVLTPPVVPHYVARPRVLERLDAGHRHPLSIVVAPAGYGKSALLAGWASNATRSVSWLRLDVSDNDPAVFARYLVESVRVVAPVVAGPAAEAAESGVSPSEVIAALIEGVRGSAAALVTIVDDLHRIFEPQVLELCASTIDSLPDSWRWIVSGRTEPPIGLARHRLERSLTEITEEDLRFDDEGAHRLITRGLAVDASREAVRRLNHRVHGWAAGLCMAGLAARQAVDADATLLGYSGSDRHLGQYFADEVFALLPARLQEFLLETSVLHELQPDFCEAVIGRGDAADLLAETERRHLFISRVDDRRPDVYEYHDLFSEWLEAELAHRKPGRAAALRRRAAAWAVAQGLEAQGVRYLLDAADWDGASELIRRLGYRLIQRGLSRSVMTWVTTLPDEAIRRSLDLALIGGDAAIHAGEWPTATRLASLARTADGTTPAGRTIQLGGLQLAWLGSLYTGTLTDMRRVTAEIEALVAQVPTDAVPHHQGEDIARALGLAAAFHYVVGDVETALERIARARQSGDSVFSNLLSDSVEALARYERGEIERAAELARAGLARASDIPQPPLASVPTALAALWTGDDADAHRAAQLLAKVLKQSRLPFAEVLRHVSDAEDWRRTGRPRQARASLAAADHELRSLREPGFVQRWVDLQAARRDPSELELEPLSPRERDVLRLLPTRLTRREIAVELGISLDTVKTHALRIYRKLGVSTRSDAVRRARQLDLA